MQTEEPARGPEMPTMRARGRRRSPHSGARVDLMAACALLLTALAVAFIALPCISLVLRVDPAQAWQALSREAVREALVLSLQTSVAATGLCVLLGSPAAFALARIDFAGRRLVDAVLQLPLVLPPVVAGVGLLMAFGRRGLLGGALHAAGLEIPFTTLAVVIAQMFMGFPLYLQSARSGFEAVPRALEEASRTLGAGSLSTFLRVTVPLSWGAMVSGAVLTWGRAMGEFGATVVFAGNMRGTTRTMPLAILTALQGDVDAAVVLAVMLLAASAVIFVGARWVLTGSRAPL